MIKKLLVAALLLTVLAADFSFAAKNRQIPAEVGIQKVDAVSDMFSDGYKITTVTILYKKKLDPASVSVDDYEVEGQYVKSVEVNGTKVTLHLDTSNIWYPERENSRELNGKNTFGKYAIVTQKGDVTTSDGKDTYTGSFTITSEKLKEPKICKKFWEKTYLDDETNVEVRYAVFTPDNYDKGWKYPVIVFVPDSRATSNVSRASLLQGMGGSIWATDAEQQKHQAIVIVVQYPKYAEEKFGPLVSEDGSWNAKLEAIYRLVNKEIGNSRADKHRIYGVGQGEGAAANLLIGQKYPSFYAGQIAISPLYEIRDIDALAQEKLWIMVSSKDRQSCSAMEKSLKPLFEKPGKLCKETWPVDLSDEGFAKAAKDQIDKEALNNYTVIDGGTREYTWCIGYNIEEIREWLLAH
ncbi:MAG: hypothetical protein IJ828_07750 [Treponema sp.]|nr:hypothetical protein [Treponema sp.]